MKKRSVSVPGRQGVDVTVSCEESREDKIL